MAGALDIKKVGSDVGRFAREGDFDWEKLGGVNTNSVMPSNA